MGMKEAAKTSIVSKRWRYLWAKRIHLDFDHFLAFPETRPAIDRCSFTVAQQDKYINWVNQVLGLHGSEYIDTLRVCFVFDSNESSDAHHFDKWVKFALFRKVKNLELYSPFCKVPYTLGFDILNPSVAVGDSGITSLTSLHLHNVDVAGDFIEFLLSKCHNLERLYVGFSSLLVRLKVIGLSCKLKQLAIRSCTELVELEIDAVDLVYFDFVGRNHRTETNVVFKSRPMLVEASFGGTCFGSPVAIFQQNAHIAAPIYKLSLDMRYSWFLAGALPTFCNLKHLNLVVRFMPSEFVYITSLLEACPVLHEFKLEILWCFAEIEAMVLLRNVPFEEYVDPLKLLQIEGKTHPNLKLLEVVGYCGSNYDVHIILSIAHYACNLETIICDPNRTFCLGDDREISRARAYKLKKMIPPRINVIII